MFVGLQNIRLNVNIQNTKYLSLFLQLMELLLCNCIFVFVYLYCYFINYLKAEFGDNKVLPWRKCLGVCYYGHFVFCVLVLHILLIISWFDHFLDSPSWAYSSLHSEVLCPMLSLGLFAGDELVYTVCIMASVSFSFRCGESFYQIQ